MEKTVAFTPPVIVDIPVEDEIPIQEDMEDTKASTETNDTENENWSPPVVGEKQPEVTDKDNLIEVMTQYFLLVNEIPYDNFSIQFYEHQFHKDKDKWIHIQLTYDSAEDAYEHIDALKEYQLEKDMSDMFPYNFIVESCVS